MGGATFRFSPTSLVMLSLAFSARNLATGFFFFFITTFFGDSLSPPSLETSSLFL
jgi:hypothetical protein